MGRRPKFSSEQIVDAAEEILASDGPGATTVVAIAEHLDAPSGSIYHRFASRDLILGHVWLRTVRRAQEGFLEALVDGSLDSATAAALHVPRWSRANLARAKILVLYRREDLSSTWPDELGEELSGLNDAIATAVRNFTRLRYGATRRELVERVTFALIDVPYAAVRRHLIAGVAPPRSVDPLVERVVTEVLGRSTN
jgi:AcrR family transcriptional regulator